MNTEEEIEKDNPYEPDGVHEDFNIYRDEKEQKVKQLYRFINKKDEKIGNYYAMGPDRIAKKILRWIHLKTGIKNPIYRFYNEDTDTLYKYAGQVEDNMDKKTKNIVLNIEENYDDGTKKNIRKKIQIKYKYIVRQVGIKKNYQKMIIQ